MGHPVTKPDLLRGLDPASAHIAAAGRGTPGEIAKNRLDMEELIQRYISDTMRPKILSWDPYQVDNDSAITVTFKGRDLITPGWLRASHTIGTVVGNNALVWTAILPGVGGNNLTIRYVTGGGLVLSVSGNDITVTLNTGVTTAGDIITALASSNAIKKMVSVANATGSSGAGLATVMSAHEHLMGGTGARLLTAYLRRAEGSNKDLLFRARIPGPRGNQISVAYVDGGAGYVVPVVTCAGSAITVTMQIATTTANAVLAALRAHAVAKTLVDVCLSLTAATGTNNGTGAPAAFAHTHLSDHATDWDAGWVPELGGIPAVVSTTVGLTSITDDTIVLAAPIAIAPLVKEGACFLKLPTCGIIHRLYMGIKD